jgi:hypothetical protein
MIGLADTDRARVGVDVAPTQREDLATAQTRGCGKYQHAARLRRTGVQDGADCRSAWRFDATGWSPHPSHSGRRVRSDQLLVDRGGEDHPHRCQDIADRVGRRARRSPFGGVGLDLTACNRGQGKVAEARKQFPDESSPIAH